MHLDVVCCVQLPFSSSHQALTHVAVEDEAAASCGAMAGRSLLELEQHSAGQKRKLLVLQLVATLCESVSDTVFTNIAQVGDGKALGEQQLGSVAQRSVPLGSRYIIAKKQQEKTGMSPGKAAY